MTLNNPALCLSKLFCLPARCSIGEIGDTCCFQGNFLGTRQIALLPLDPEVTRDNAFKVSKALRHPCLKFHLKLLCYSYYYTQGLTSLSYQPSSQYLHLWAQSHAPRVILQGSGCWWAGQAGGAGQGTVQCLAVHETGTKRGFLPSSFSLSPE